MCKEARVKKIAAKKRISCDSATNAPLKVRKCAEPPAEHLRSEISSRALATLQNIGKARKQEAI